MKVHSQAHFPHVVSEESQEHRPPGVVSKLSRGRGQAASEACQKELPNPFGVLREPDGEANSRWPPARIANRPGGPRAAGRAQRGRR
jgi:hypothetical protein